jgi:hypothetical protein
MALILVDNPGLTYELPLHDRWGYGEPSVRQEYSETINLERYVEQILAPLFENLND